MSSTASASAADPKPASVETIPVAEHLRLVGTQGVSAMLADIVKRAQQRSAKAQILGIR